MPETMTAAQIRSKLDLDHSLFVERDGVRYYIGENEDGDGWFAWAVGEDGIGKRGAVASFGECDWPAGISIFEATPNYGPLSERIADWLAVPTREGADG